MENFPHSRILLIADADRKAANEAARQLDPDPACGDTFIVALSASGKEPPTHWVTQVRLTDSGLKAVSDLISSGTFAGAVMADGDTLLLPQFLVQMKLQRVEPD